MHKVKFIKVLTFTIIIVSLLFAISTIASCKEKMANEEILKEERVGKGVMKIESPSFNNNEMIPLKYTCDGVNVNPPLVISGTPEDAKSLVLIVDDPDAPSKTWVHWTMWNINPDIKEIPESVIPDGAIEGMTDFGRQGYEGPCPPSGVHHYYFKLYALDITINLGSSASIMDIQEAMHGHILDSAELIGLYGRD